MVMFVFYIILRNMSIDSLITDLMCGKRYPIAGTFWADLDLETEFLGRPG